MKLISFLVGVLVAIGFGGIGLLLDAVSEKGIRYLQNDLIAMGLIALFVGACFVLIVSLSDDL